MSKSNIGLGGILGAFIGDQSPTSNPLYGASYDEDSNQWMGQDGQTPLPDQHQQTLNDAYNKDPNGDVSHLTSQYWNTPSLSTKLFHPDVAQQENNFNTQWNAQGPEAQHTNTIQQGILKNNFTTNYRSQYPNATQSDIDTAFGASGGNATATATEGAKIARAAIDAGVPVSTAASQQASNLASKAQSDNAKAIADADAKNMSTITGTRTKGQNTEGILASITKDQANWQQQATPDILAQKSTALDTQKYIGQLENSIAQGNLGDAQKTVKANHDMATARANEATQAAYSSQRAPLPQSPYSMDVNTHEVGATPGFVPKIKQLQGELNGVTPEGNVSTRLSDGTVVSINGKSLGMPQQGQLAQKVSQPMRVANPSNRTPTLGETVAPVGNAIKAGGGILSNAISGLGSMVHGSMTAKDDEGHAILTPSGQYISNDGQGQDGVQYMLDKSGKIKLDADGSPIPITSAWAKKTKQVAGGTR